MPKTLVPVGTPAQETESFDIEQTSKACGLSAGVLRMWELRYGWPRPGRLPNGYRYFTRYQIEDLKRMSALVKSGMLISRLVQDGMPKWPSDGTTPKNAGPVTLESTMALPKPRHAIANTIREALIEALKTHNHGRTWEMMQRCGWEVHPAEQVLCAWLPCLVAFDEFKRKDKPFERQDLLHKHIRDHIKDVLGRFPPEERPLWVIPATEADNTLAYVTALIVSARGQAARPWLWEQSPKSGSKYITVGEQTPARANPEQHLGHLPLIGTAEKPGITSLVQDGNVPAWLSANIK
jgi:hypothetical protein